MRRNGGLVSCLGLCLLLAGGVTSCQTETAELQAFKVTDRSQLPGGGPRALGDVGDYVIMNDRIRVVIQDAGFSRGFGVYGGGIIDADLRRPDERGRGQSIEAGGQDIFAEMFPSFFFQAVDCDKVEVLTDGSKAYDKRYGGKRVHYDAGTAVIRASGGGGEFLTLLHLFDSIFLGFIVSTSNASEDGSQELLRLALLLNNSFADFAIEVAKILNVNARYEVDYILRPGEPHIEIRSRMVNTTSFPLLIPSPLLKNPTFRAQFGNVDLSTLRVPIGTVMLFGKLNNVWMPGYGFDLRHPMDRAFQRALPLPAFSGLFGEFLASAAHRLDDRVSYGLIAMPSENNFVKVNESLYRTGGKFKDTWTPLDDASLLVPFSANSFLGVFGDSVQSTIAAGEYAEQVQKFIVGDGDVASIADEVHRVRGAATGGYQGILRDAFTGGPTREGQVIIYQELPEGTVSAADFLDADEYLDSGLRLCAITSENTLCRPYSQDYPDDAGNLMGSLPAGRYAYRVQGAGRVLGPFVPFEVKEGRHTAIEPRLARPGWIQVHVADSHGRSLPAKAMAVAQYAAASSDAKRRSGQVFDIEAGEEMRHTDLLDDTVDGQRAWIEEGTYTGADGNAAMMVRPGDYLVYFSRGFEYDMVKVPVHVEAGNAATASAQLTRVVDTTGWMSYDGHIHHEDSIDSSMAQGDRLRAAAGEGLEIAIATNHNFVSDWRDGLAARGLSPWVTTFVGIEFTTLESGHFNSYPLDYPIGLVTHGSFQWFGHPPDELFAGLRQLAASRGGDNIVVCNHPRDAILGYFSQYGRSSITGGMVSAGQSKRLAGPNGPAFFDANGQSTISYGCDALELVNGKLAHEVRSVRVPPDWPPACYRPLPVDFDPAKDIDPCSLRGKVLRPSTTREALVPGTILLDVSNGPPGPSGLDNVEAVFPGVVDDWFHMLNQGHRHTGIATSDSHGGVGEEVGSPRTWLQLGTDDPVRVDEDLFVDAVKRRKAVTMGNGPFLTFTVSPAGANAATSIGGELRVAVGGNVTVNYRLAAAPWVSVARLHVYLNGRRVARIDVDPDRNLADVGGMPLTGEVPITVERDSWIVLEAVGDRPMFPMVCGTEEPFLLVSDAVGALAGALGLSATTDIGAVVVGNERPYALTNPVWLKTTEGEWNPPGVVPFQEINVPEQDPQMGVLPTRN